MKPSVAVCVCDHAFDGNRHPLSVSQESLWDESNNIRSETQVVATRTFRARSRYHSQHQGGPLGSTGSMYTTLCWISSPTLSEK